MPRKKDTESTDAPDPVARGRELARTGKKAAAEGMTIIRAELREVREHNQFKPEPIGLDKATVLAEMVKPQKSIREGLIEHALDCIRRERRVAAGLAFAQLRNTFDRDRDWIEFILKHLPPADNGRLSWAEIERLIGKVVHRKAMMRCKKCGTGQIVQCECGAAYLPEVPWEEVDEDAPQTILDRAVAAVKAYPDKPNRLIAREIIVSEFTVRQARKKIAGKTHPGEIAPKAPAPPPVRPDKDLIQDLPEEESEARRFSWSFGHAAGDAIAADAFWIREFGDWTRYLGEPEYLALAERAAESWNLVVLKIRSHRGRKP